jgi:hypothetical protein
MPEQGSELSENSPLIMYREKFLAYLQFKYGDLISKTQSSIRPKTISPEESILYVNRSSEDLQDALFAATLANGNGRGVLSSEYFAKYTAKHPVTYEAHPLHFSNREIIVSTMIAYLRGLLSEWEKNTFVLLDFPNPFDEGHFSVIQTPHTFPLLSSSRKNVQTMIDQLHNYLRKSSSSKHIPFDSVIDKHLQDTREAFFKDVARYRWLKQLSSQGVEFSKFLNNLCGHNLTIEIQPMEDEKNERRVSKYINNASMRQYLPYILQTILSDIKEPPTMLTAISEPFGFPEMNDFVEQIRQRMKSEYPIDDKFATIPDFYKFPPENEAEVKVL